MLQTITPPVKSRSNRRGKKPIIVVCLDGCSWENLSLSNESNLKEIGRTGTLVHAKSMVPTVTNVNNASIITGKFPRDHGVSGNFCLDAARGSMCYMDSPNFLKCSTLLGEASAKVCALFF